MSVTLWVQWLAMTDSVEFFFKRHDLEIPAMLRQEYRGGRLPVFRTNAGFVMIFDETLLPVALVGEFNMHAIYPFDFPNNATRYDWQNEYFLKFASSLSLKFLRQPSRTLSLESSVHTFFVYAVTRLNDEDVVPTTELVIQSA